MDKTQLILAIFGIVIGIYAFVKLIIFLLKRTNKSEKQIINQAIERNKIEEQPFVKEQKVEEEKKSIPPTMAGQK